MARGTSASTALGAAGRRSGYWPWRALRSPRILGARPAWLRRAWLAPALARSCPRGMTVDAARRACPAGMTAMPAPLPQGAQRKNIATGSRSPPAEATPAGQALPPGITAEDASDVADPRGHCAPRQQRVSGAASSTFRSDRVLAGPPHRRGGRRRHPWRQGIKGHGRLSARTRSFNSSSNGCSSHRPE